MDSIHGWRHWFAGIATEMGCSDVIISPLLGHSWRVISGRYPNAPDTALIAAADRIARRLDDSQGGRRGAGKVITRA